MTHPSGPSGPNRTRHRVPPPPPPKAGPSAPPGYTRGPIIDYFEPPSETTPEDLSPEANRSHYHALLAKAQRVAADWDESVYLPLLKGLREFGEEGGIPRAELDREERALFWKFAQGQLNHAEHFFGAVGTPSGDLASVISADDNVHRARDYARRGGIPDEEFNKELKRVFDAARGANERLARDFFGQATHAIMTGLRDAIIHTDFTPLASGLRTGLGHLGTSLKLFLNS